MPVFQAKARTADTYLVGIGASGALIASVFVTFMILVGAVTFDAWPRAASLIGGGGGKVSIETAPTSAPVQASPPPSQGPSEPEPRTIDNPGLGGTVANLGETLNGTLQNLAGSL